MSDTSEREPANETRWQPTGGGAEILAKAEREHRDLTTGETAEILGTSIATVRRMVDRGLLVGTRVASFSSLGVDVRGHELHGHRRVSTASVVLAIAEMAERERLTKGAAERHRQARASRLDEQLAHMDERLAQLGAKRRAYRSRANAGQGPAQSRIAGIDERLVDLKARREAIRKTKADLNRLLAAEASQKNSTPDTLDT